MKLSFRGQLVGWAITALGVAFIAGSVRRLMGVCIMSGEPKPTAVVYLADAAPELTAALLAGAVVLVGAAVGLVVAALRHQPAHCPHCNGALFTGMTMWGRELVEKR